MNEIEQTLEGRLSQEARQRYLLNLYEEGSFDQLFDAACYLNLAYSMEMVKARWFAKEAADNLAEAYEYQRKAQKG